MGLNTCDFVCGSISDIVGQIFNNFKKNCAFYDKSMKLGTFLVDSNTN